MPLATMGTQNTSITFCDVQPKNLQHPQFQLAHTKSPTNGCTQASISTPWMGGLLLHLTPSANGSCTTLHCLEKPQARVGVSEKTLYRLRIRLHNSILQKKGVFQYIFTPSSLTVVVQLLGRISTIHHAYKNGGSVIP